MITKLIYIFEIHIVKTFKKAYTTESSKIKPKNAQLHIV